MQSDDQLLWEKVVNDAGIRNELVLSMAETTRANVLLGDAERKLLAMDQEIAALLAQRQIHAEHVEKFRVAVAPIKRLPVELLANIFSHFVPAYDDASLAPWFLGQVCALWRQVSRSNSKCWSVTMDDSESSIRLVEILPPNANTCLHVKSSFNAMIPIFHHIKDLRLCVGILELNMLRYIGGPETFVNLENLYLYIHGDVAVEQPSLDFPHDSSQWDEHDEHSPFHLARNLQSFTFQCFDSRVNLEGALLILERLHFPWNQLLSLDLHLPAAVLAADKYTLLLQDVLNGIQSLHSLTATIDSNYDEIRELQIESPASIALRGMQPEGWASLSSLDVTSAAITDCSLLRQVLTECQQLTELFSTVPNPSGVFDKVNRDIFLPHLKYLYLEGIEHSWMFRSLITPVLSQLGLDFEYEYCFDVAAVRHMITSSGCSIQGFTCRWVGDIQYPYLPDPFFVAIPTARRVQLEGISLDKDVSAKLAQGEILPCVEKLEWLIKSPDQYIQLIEARAEWELKTHGRVVLKQWGCGIVFEGEASGYLRDLGEKYGINVANGPTHGF